MGVEMKLKVGDRVRVNCKESVFFGCEGEVVSFMGGKYPNVLLDPGQKADMPVSDTPWLFIPCDVELIISSAECIEEVIL